MDNLGLVFTHGTYGIIASGFIHLQCLAHFLAAFKKVSA